MVSIELSVGLHRPLSATIEHIVWYYGLFVVSSELSVGLHRPLSGTIEHIVWYWVVRG